MIHFDNGVIHAPLYTVGVDLGDAKDYTSIVIMERPLWVGTEDSGWRYWTKFMGGPEDGGWVAPDSMSGPQDAIDLAYLNLKYGRMSYPTYSVRHAERLPLGSGYPRVVDVVSGYVKQLEEYNPTLLVDHTGVGRAVVQSFRNAGLSPVGIHLHAGADVREVPEEMRFNVPVRELVSSAQVMLEHGRIKIASELEHAEALKHELLNFHRKINPTTAHESFSAWRERDHDDLIFGLAMCSWYHAYHAEPFEVERQNDFYRIFGGSPETQEREKTRSELAAEGLQNMPKLRHDGRWA